MLHIPLWRRLFILAVCVVGLVLALPNLFYSRVEVANDAQARLEAGSTETIDAADAALWPTWLPNGIVNLGLDLRGGAHLLAEVQVEDVYAGRMDGLWPEVRDALAAERDTPGLRHPRRERAGGRAVGDGVEPGRDAAGAGDRQAAWRGRSRA